MVTTPSVTPGPRVRADLPRVTCPGPSGTRLPRAASSQGHLAEDDAILCVSEMVSNAIQHSASSRPGGTVTVRAVIHPDNRLRVEVQDNGGPWIRRTHDDQRLHGLGIIASLTDAHGTAGDPATGWLAWFEIIRAPAPEIVTQPAPGQRRSTCDARPQVAAARAPHLARRGQPATLGPR